MIINKLPIALILAFNVSALQANTASQCEDFFNNELFQQALTQCSIDAKQGDLAAQTFLGEMFDAGKGTNIDRTKALELWQQASAQSYLPAQNLLALKYYYGGELFEQQAEWQQDYKKAFDIWSDGAHKGIATSQFMLGELYKDGQGVKQDYAESYAWYKIALQGGYKLATDTLIELSKVITAQEKQQGMQRINEIKSSIVLR